MGKREKELERARRSPRGWTSDAVCHLYKLWGFVSPSRSGHGGELKYYHPKYPDIISFVTKSSGDIAPFYVREAVEKIETFCQREGIDV